MTNAQPNTNTEPKTEIGNAQAVNQNAGVSIEVSPAEISSPASLHISFDDFLKVNLRVGKVLSAEGVEGSAKLLRLTVDFAEGAPRQVLSGIAKTFQPDQLVGNSFVFVVNLEPRKIMGMESQAMILAASDDQGLVLFSPTREIKEGAELG